MREHNIINFLKKNITPVNDVYGIGYPAAAYLEDGTYLPCVIFRSTGPTINLAIKRFKEEQPGRGILSMGASPAYYKIVKSFVTSGNCVNFYDIEKVEESPFALPAHIEKMVMGETSMGYTGFTGRMKDGKLFGFGSKFNTQFFSMPEGYTGKDIEEITNHSFVDQHGELRFHRSNSNQDVKWDKLNVYTQRVFFECYLDGL